MLTGKKCLVVGSGISGVAAVGLLSAFGNRIFFYDSNENLTIDDLEAKLPKGVSARCFTRTLPVEVMEKIEYAILSPGVPTDLPLICDLRGLGVKILGEIELAYLAEKGRVAAITGTNGKTTTTTLLGEIMKAHLGEDRTLVVGNIGNPYTGEVLRSSANTVTVAELSSFQLETIDTFRPKVSAILNLTPDHLNRHYTMEAYGAAKEKIAINQTRDDLCVLNYENVYTREFGKRSSATVVYFSSQRELEEGYFLRGTHVIRRFEGRDMDLMDYKRDMTLVGIHNAENVMAAIAMAEGMGVPMTTILNTIRSFRGVEHRIEYVATKNDVVYYNDSKGTNPDAAIQAIRAMDRPTVLIGGGYDKHNSFDRWIESFGGRVKWLVLIGQTKEKIAECAASHGMHQVKLADTYEECLKLCTELAQPGDAVLLSPACASWGMFPNYEIRGKLFKEYVNSLPDKKKE